MIDIVIAVVLIAFTAAGWKHGLIRTLVGLAAMVLAVGLSSQIARAAAPEIVDRYLRPATYAAIEERAQELAKGEEVSSVEDLRRDLSQVLDAIPNDFIREKAQDAVDGLLPQGEALGGALLAPLEELGRDMADRVLDTLVQDVLRSILCAALFVILSAVFRIVAGQLNELGGALAGLAKGLVLVCLALWVLCHTGVITPEMAEGSVVLGLLPGWIAGTGK